VIVDLHIRDTDYNFTESVSNTEWMYVCKELSSGVILIGGRKVSTIDITTTKVEEYIAVDDDTVSILIAESGFMIFEQESKILVSRDRYALKCLDKKHGFRASVTLWNDTIGYVSTNNILCIYDIKNDLLQEYGFPLNWNRIYTFVLE
jgi:hypothetical protein